MLYFDSLYGSKAFLTGVFMGTQDLNGLDLILTPPDRLLRLPVHPGRAGQAEHFNLIGFPERGQKMIPALCGGNADTILLDFI